MILLQYKRRFTRQEKSKNKVFRPFIPRRGNLTLTVSIISDLGSLASLKQRRGATKSNRYQTEVPNHQQDATENEQRATYRTAK